jgi:hypothetical protein
MLAPPAMRTITHFHQPVAMPRIMDYTAYYPLYNPRSLVTQSQIAKYSTNFSTGLTILNPRSVLITPYDTLKDFRKKGAKRFLFGGTMATVLGKAECGSLNLNFCSKWT